MEFMMNIRKKSSALHAAAEKSGFIKRIVDGNASKESYSEYLFNLLAVYEVLENAIEKNSDNDVMKAFVTKELYRSEFIKKDLEFLLGDKLASMELLSSTEAFVSRMNELQKTKPELVIAHAYTRFLADLFGGRTFFSLLSDKYEIPTEGLNYYTFDGIKDMRGYAMGYHNKLNEMQLSEDLKADFVNEVNNAYIYNIAISNELEAKLYNK